jgi:hypothetical protein
VLEGVPVSVRQQFYFTTVELQHTIRKMSVIGNVKNVMDVEGLTHGFFSCRTKSSGLVHVETPEAACYTIPLRTIKDLVVRFLTAVTAVGINVL